MGTGSGKRGGALRGRPAGDATIEGSGKSGVWDFVRERHIKRKFDEIFLAKAASFCVDKRGKI